MYVLIFYFSIYARYILLFDIICFYENYLKTKYYSRFLEDSLCNKNHGSSSFSKCFFNTTFNPEVLEYFNQFLIIIILIVYILNLLFPRSCFFVLLVTTLTPFRFRYVLFCSLSIYGLIFQHLSLYVIL